MTRPAARSDRFAQALRAQFGDDLNIVIAPVMRIESCAPPDAVPPQTDVIFTSASAVAALCDQMPAPGTAAFCVGTATTQAARAEDWQASCVGPDADALVAGLLRDPPSRPLIHMRGTHARGDVAGRLSANGVPCAECVVYRQVAETLTVPAQKLLKSASPVIVPLFSPRSARLLSDKLPPQTGDLWLVTISAAATRAWGDAPCARLVQAETPDLPGMLAAMAPLISQVRKLEGGGRAG